MIAVTFLALLLLQAPFSPPPQQGASKSPTATLEGFVFRADSGEPLGRAQVTLVRVAPGRTAVEVEVGSVSATPLTAATGADGKFAFIDIEPGSYRIAVARNGYARQEYGQRVFAGQGRVITLAPGQSMTGIAFQLLPTGSVSGVVKDASGEPLAGAQVQVFPAGRRTVVRRILARARTHLTPGGVVVLEVGAGRLAVEAVFPALEPTCLETSAGGDQVFLLERDQLPA